MDLLIIAGFLGAGKTSVLVPLAKAFVQAGRRVAIIENEVGKVGVDDQLLKSEGLPVKELFSGCICCSLRLDLVSTMLELERSYRPDVVLLEPSGVAGPDAVADAFNGYGGEIARRQVVTVVDAARFETLFKLNLPIFQAGLNVADLVLINKMDKVDAAALARIETAIRSLRSEVKVRPVSALHGTNLDGVVAGLLAAATAPPQTPAAATPGSAGPNRPAAARARLPRANPGPEPAVFAGECELHYPAPVGSARLCLDLQQRLRQLDQALQAEGATLIGHVKAIVRGPQAGYLMFSLTAFNGEIQARGALLRELTEARLTLNAIVYGVAPDTLERLGDALLAPPA